MNDGLAEVSPCMEFDARSWSMPPLAGSARRWSRMGRGAPVPSSKRPRVDARAVAVGSRPGGLLASQASACFHALLAGRLPRAREAALSRPGGRASATPASTPFARASWRRLRLCSPWLHRCLPRPVQGLKPPGSAQGPASSASGSFAWSWDRRTPERGAPGLGPRAPPCPRHRARPEGRDARPRRGTSGPDRSGSLQRSRASDAAMVRGGRGAGRPPSLRPTPPQPGSMIRPRPTRPASPRGRRPARPPRPGRPTGRGRPARRARCRPSCHGPGDRPAPPEGSPWGP